MSSISIDTTQNVTITYELAGVAERVGAFIIDAMIMGAIMIAFLIAGLSLKSSAAMDSENFGIGIALMIFLVFLYPLIAEATMDGQTLGKRAVGTRVVRLDGSAATFGNFALRFLLGIVENGVFSGSVSLFSILISKNRQRLGDLAAGTVVVKVPKQASLQLSQLRTTDEGSRTLVFEEVRLLTERDVTIIREVLRATRNSAYTIEVRTTMVNAAKERIESILHITSELGANEFLVQVLEDYSTLHGTPTNGSAHPTTS